MRAEERRQAIRELLRRAKATCQRNGPGGSILRQPTDHRGGYCPLAGGWSRHLRYAPGLRDPARQEVWCGRWPSSTMPLVWERS